MKVIAITKVQTSKGEVVDRMQTMIVTLQPGDKTLSDTTAFVRTDDFDANKLLTTIPDYCVSKGPPEKPRTADEQ